MFWKWARDDDDARLAEAREAWLREGGAQARLALSREGSSTPSGSGPPWGRWALRVGDQRLSAEMSSRAAALIEGLCGALQGGGPAALERFGLGFGLLAGYVAVGSSAGSDAVRGALASWLLDVAGRVRRGVDARDVGASDVEARGVGARDVGAVGDARSARERVCAGCLGLALGVPVVLAGGDARAWVPFTEAAGALVALLDGWERLWLDGSARSIDDAEATAWVTEALRSGARDEVLLALAGDRRQAARRDEVREALSVPAVVEHVTSVWRRRVEEARAALPAPVSEVGGELLAALEQSFGFARSYGWIRAQGRSPAPVAPRWSWASVEVDIERAVQRVELDPRCTASIDVQRWGIAPLSADVVADWFPVGLVELALRDIAPERDSARRRALLEGLGPGAPRYYDRWRGIPPDADSLGVALQLASDLEGFPESRIAEWTRTMEENLRADGVPHLWFHRANGAPAHEPPDMPFAGDDCTASILSLALGLAHLAEPRFEATIAAIVAWALARFRDGVFEGSFHYRPEYASRLFVQLASRVARSGRSAAMLEDMRACCETIARITLETQRIDGSWGSPLATAWSLETLCLVRPSREPLSSAIARASRFLSETQRGDGSWSPELLYFTVGKPGYMVEHRGLEITTAMCARALAKALREHRLSEGLRDREVEPVEWTQPHGATPRARRRRRAR